MSVFKEESFDLQCRLCTSSKKGHIQIFGEDEKSRILYRKIKECLPIHIQKDDLLPKSICLDCISKLEEFSKFRESSLKVEQHFESFLKEPQQPTTFALEPECCLQEVEPNAVESQSENANLRQEQIKLAAKGIEIIPNPPLPKELRNAADLIVTPLMHNSVLTNNNHLTCSPTFEKPKAKLGNPKPDDYVLMKEETFNLDLNQENLKGSMKSLMGNMSLIEFRNVDKDRDILNSQIAKKEVLPPMWDVYEKIISDKENTNQNGKSLVITVTHRRYIISKNSFNCSVCNGCLDFDIDRHQREIDFSSSNAVPKWSKDAGIEIVCKNPEDIQNCSIDSANSGITIESISGGGPSTLMVPLIYNCQVCGKYFPRRSSFKRHQRTHLENKPYSCMLCGKGFNRREHMIRHKSCHIGGRPYLCHLCNKLFSRKEHLIRHQQTHSVNFRSNSGDSSNGALDIVKAEYGTEGDDALEMVKTEYGTDADEALDIVKTEYGTDCAETSASANDSKMANSGSEVGDESNLPQSERPYNCEICCQGFARKEHLLRHKRRMHVANFGKVGGNDDLKPYGCQVCLKRFTRKEHLVRHEKIHLRELVYGTRKLPDGKMALAALLGQRIKTEPTSPPHVPQTPLNPILPPALNQSPEADDGASTKAESPQQKPYPCPFCSEKSFTRRSHLVRHLKRFHPECDPGSIGGQVDGARHSCEICGQTFGRKYHLERHRKLHFSQQAFHCSACSVSFPNHEAFREHNCTPKELVSGESGNPAHAATNIIPARREFRRRSRNALLYECNVCGKGFSRKKFLNKHAELHADRTIESDGQDEEGGGEANDAI